jgi:hypothetical protein
VRLVFWICKASWTFAQLGSQFAAYALIPLSIVTQTGVWGRFVTKTPALVGSLVFMDSTYLLYESLCDLFVKLQIGTTKKRLVSGEL